MGNRRRNHWMSEKKVKSKERTVKVSEEYLSTIFFFCISTYFFLGRFVSLSMVWFFFDFFSTYTNKTFFRTNKVVDVPNSIRSPFIVQNKLRCQRIIFVRHFYRFIYFHLSSVFLFILSIFLFLFWFSFSSFLSSLFIIILLRHVFMPLHSPRLVVTEFSDGFVYISNCDKHNYANFGCFNEQKQHYINLASCVFSRCRLLLSFLFLLSSPFQVGFFYTSSAYKCYSFSCCRWFRFLFFLRTVTKKTKAIFVCKLTTVSSLFNGLCACH